jgi:hypothetical protein
VNASFKQLTHGELWKSHVFFLSGFYPRQSCLRPAGPTGGRYGISPRKAQASPVKCAPFTAANPQPQAESPASDFILA